MIITKKRKEQGGNKQSDSSRSWNAR